MSLEVYSSLTSVAQGGSISFHGSSDPPGDVKVEIRIVSLSDRVMHTGVQSVEWNEKPRNFERRGCGWPAFDTLVIPDDWQSGLYEAIFNREGEEARLYFVVRTAVPASQSKTLLQFPVTTVQAYNGGDNHDLYGTPYDQRLRRVSFDRPTDFGKYTEAIILLLWMEENRFECECCTSMDIHQDDGLLDHYDLFISAGHDEYWSREMRDHVEDFVTGGGNAAFFSGNVCWWQVRFRRNDRVMICYKSADEDPYMNRDASLVTVNWGDPPIGRPSNSLSGVNFHQGAGAWNECAGRRVNKAFEVLFAEHWVFQDTELQDGETFGAGGEVIGYETDGVKFKWAEGARVPLEDDLSISDFVILGFADLTDWDEKTCGQPGVATMGLFRRGGTVFTGATIGWVYGLQQPAMATITRNVIGKLQSRAEDVEWVSAGYAIGVSCMTGLGADDRLFAVTHDNQLWLRFSTGQKIPWTAVSANSVATIRAIAGAGDTPEGPKLFAATDTNRLLWRRPTHAYADWIDVGHAIDVVAMAFAAGKLFAATSDNRLWWRDPVGREIDWTPIGHAIDVVAMTGLEDQLFALTTDGILWNRAAVGTDLDWVPIGNSTGFVALAVSRNHFFAATNDDQLLWR